MTKLARLVLEKKEIIIRLKYAIRRGMDTDSYTQELAANEKARIFEAAQENARAEYYAY